MVSRNPKPKRKTAAQTAAQQRSEDAKNLAVQNNRAKAQAAQLAQIINLQIAGFTLEEIGAQIGASATEVDNLINSSAARYIRNQPALRIYVRNWISGKLTEMIDADWDIAVDKTHADRLDNQDRVMRMLTSMARLHGAEAPSQTEVKVEAAPEAVDALVAALAAQNGVGYDVNIFDVVPGQTVHSAVEETTQAIEAASDAVEQPQPGDDGL